MASVSDPENDFRQGDLETTILRKILDRLRGVITTIDAAAPVVSVSNFPNQYVGDPAFLASSSGLVSGKAAAVYHVISRRAGFNSTSVLQDVAEFLGAATDAMPELTGAESLEVVSSSASDASAGLGVRTLQVGYITTGYALATANITMNGVTPVATGFAARQILWMEALTVGATTVAVGNIILRVVAGATHEQITAGGNRSLSSHFMVPDGYSAYIADWHATSIGGATQDVRLRATVRTAGRVLNDAYVFQDNVFVSAGAFADGPLPWLRYPARTKIKVSTITSGTAASNRVDADFSVLLIAD